MSIFDFFLRPNIDKLKRTKNLKGILKAVSYKEWTIRLQAVGALVDFKEHGVIEALVSCLKDNNWKVRLQALSVLENIQHPDKIVLLIDVLQDKYVDSAIRNQLATALAKLNDERIAPALRNLEREAANLRMEYLASELARYKCNKDKLIEECVAFGTEVVPYLLEVLETSEGGYVCEALGRIGDNRAVEALIRVFERDKRGGASWLLAERAAVALGRIGDSRAIEPLLTAFQSSGTGDGEKVCSAWALGKLGVSEVEEDLKEMVAHVGTIWRGLYVRREMEQMLVNVLQELRSKTLGPDRAFSIRRQDIIEALSSDDVAVRKAACYESVAVGGSEIVIALINTLERYPQIQYNEVSDVYQCSRKGAAYALGKLADPSSVPALLKALAEPEPSLPMGAPFAFGTSVRKGLEEADTEFSRKLLGSEENGPTIKNTSTGKAQNKRILELIAALEPDIQTGMDADIIGRSSEAASELSKFGQPAVDPLIQALPRSSYAHFALGLIGGETAFHALCRELETSNWRRLQAAAKTLGRFGDPRALAFLRPHTATRSAEVHKAVTTAIASIERGQVGEEQWLVVDRNNPYDQVNRVWSQFNEILRDNSLRDRAIQWHHDFVSAMPELKFASDHERGATWEMLGTLIFYFLNPQVSTIRGKCPEAAYCYVQCLKYTPDREDIQDCLKRVR